MRKCRKLVPALLMLVLPPAAHATAPVMIQVLGVDGRPLAGAVVTVTMPGVAAPQPHGTYTMTQRNITFEPHVMIVPQGATVSFPNKDKVRHHVYSFSPAKRFDLKLFGHDESRSIVFDRPGAVALGCNIHDAMNGIIYVVTTPFAGITGGDGRVQLSPATTGAATVSVWHPTIRAKDNMLVQRIAVSTTGTNVAVRLPR